MPLLVLPSDMTLCRIVLDSICHSLSLLGIRSAIARPVINFVGYVRRGVEAITGFSIQATRLLPCCQVRSAGIIFFIATNTTP